MTVTLDEARETLRKREDSYTTMAVPVSELKAEPGFLRASDDRYRMTGESIARLCRQLGAPSGYIAKLDPPVQSTLLQHHLNRGDLKRDTVALVTRGDELVAIDTDALHRLKSTTVLDAVQEGIGTNDLKVHRFDVRRDSFQIELVSHIASTEVARGDYIQGGLQVSHSLIGEEARPAHIKVFSP